MNKIYTNYLEIPLLMKEYILSVSGKQKITEIPLSDINSFLEGLEKYHHDNECSQLNTSL